MKKQELWVTLLSFSVLAFMAGMAAGILLLQLQHLYIYMDYAVGDLLKEIHKPTMYNIPESWRDYGLGIITHVDTEKEIATIYWFQIQTSSFYKFRNMRVYLEIVSTGGAQKSILPWLEYIILIRREMTNEIATHSRGSAGHRVYCNQQFSRDCVEPTGRYL